MPRILLVDDDPDQLEIRKLIIELAGYGVSAATTAPAAWAMYQEAAPRIVVMDLRIPQTSDGLELIRKVRGAGGDTRIIVLSGWISDFAATPEAALVDARLAKPVPPRRLLETIAGLV